MLVRRRIIQVFVVLGGLLLAFGLLARDLMPRFMICLPVSLRMAAQTGCWVMASKDLGIMPSGQVYWHIRRFENYSSAERAKGAFGTIVESYGTVWLFAVTSEKVGPTPGDLVATIGPLRIGPDTRYAADYMEATFSPGMRSIAHRHPGPEAFYNIEGEFCLETPGKKTVVGPQQSTFVQDGTPMKLTATGTQIRRSLVLVLRPGGRMLGTPTLGWKPLGLCGAS